MRHIFDRIISPLISVARRKSRRRAASRQLGLELLEGRALLTTYIPYQTSGSPQPTYVTIDKPDLYMLTGEFTKTSTANDTFRVTIQLDASTTATINLDSDNDVNTIAVLSISGGNGAAVANNHGGFQLLFNHNTPTVFSTRAGLIHSTASFDITMAGVISPSSPLQAIPYKFDINVVRTSSPPVAPDIAVTSASVTGSVLTYSYATTGNPGPFTVALYRSADQAFDASDELVTGVTVNPSANSTNTGSFDLSTLALDPTRPYLLVVADPGKSVQEADKTNNVAAVRWLPFDIELVAADFHAGDSSISFVYTTTGTTSAFTAGLYLSHDLQFDPSDTLIATQDVAPATNSTGTATFKLGFTPAITPDRPYLLVVADPQNLIPEPNEANNTAPVRYRVFDRTAFFNSYKQEFRERLTQSQIDGLNTLLTFIELDRYMGNDQWIAYLLATTKHETGNAWIPNDEGVLANGRSVSISYFNMYEPGTRTGVNLGNTKKGDGYLYRGRGYAHTTGRNNYTKMGLITGYDLLNNPDLAFTPIVAYNLMSYGMRTGSYTGIPLSRYITDQKTDYFNARSIINGDKNSPFDKKNPDGPKIGAVVAEYATKLETIVETSLPLS